MDDLIYRESARRIIDSPRSKEQMLKILESLPHMMFSVWRVEDPVGKHGLWRNFDGTRADTFDKLTVGKCRNVPMKDDDFYRQDGMQWFAACDSPDKLKEWFCTQDIVELRKMGQNVYMFDVREIREVSDYEVVFAREDIIRQIQIDPSSIWTDFDKISAQSEITHCRECEKLQIDNIFHDYWCNGRRVRPDHYCGYAKRWEE